MRAGKISQPVADYLLFFEELQRQFIKTRLCQSPIMSMFNRIDVIKFKLISNANYW